jgi:hypothetical protein
MSKPGQPKRRRCEIILRKMEDGRWKMEDGRRKMEDGRKMPIFYLLSNIFHRAIKFTRGVSRTGFISFQIK